MTVRRTELPDLVESLRGELRVLRKGRGLLSADLDDRLGPHLRELAAGPEAVAVANRQTLVSELSGCAARLADDLRVAAAAALGLATEARGRARFMDRVGWLSGELGCAPRTALRRIDAAERLLADEIAHELRRRRGRSVDAPHGWYLEDFRTVLRLDTATPEAYEQRRIVATRDGLDEVMAWLDVPSEPDHSRPRLTAEVLHGGRLVRREQPSRTRFQFMIQLPTPLSVGEPHEYCLILRLPEGQPMRPHYIFTPECQCHSFSLRVRFHPESPPRWIRRVEGETVRLFDAAQPGPDLLSLNQAGEVHVEFGNPARFLGYGLQWAW